MPDHAAGWKTGKRRDAGLAASAQRNAFERSGHRPPAKPTAPASPNCGTHPRYSPPDERGQCYFAGKNDGLQNQPSSIARPGWTAAEPLLDPNRLSDDGTVALMNRSFAGDGTLMAYSHIGQRQRLARGAHRKTATGRVYDDLLQWAGHQPGLDPRQRRLLYSRAQRGRRPAPAPTTASTTTTAGRRKAADGLVYAPAAPACLRPHRTRRRPLPLVLHVWHGTDVPKPPLLPPHRPDPPGQGGDLIRLLDEADAAYHFIGSDGPRFYLHTTWTRRAADRHRPGPPGRARWQRSCPAETPGPGHHHQAAVCGPVAAPPTTACTATTWTAPRREDPLPGLAASPAHRPAGRQRLFLRLPIHIQPPTIFRYDLARRRARRLANPGHPFDQRVWKRTRSSTPAKMALACPCS